MKDMVARKMNDTNRLMWIELRAQWSFLQQIAWYYWYQVSWVIWELQITILLYYEDCLNISSTEYIFNFHFNLLEVDHDDDGYD